MDGMQLFPCGECFAYAYDINDPNHGECHRLPPTIVDFNNGDPITDFPRVHADDLGCLEGIHIEKSPTVMLNESSDPAELTDSSGDEEGAEN